MKRLVLLSFIFILAGAASADASRSSQARPRKIVVFGTIYDPNHAVIAYAQVVAQSFEGKEYWATSNDQGAYRIELPLARYKVEANSPGFCPRRVGFIGGRDSKMQTPFDLILEIETSERPCREKSLIKKERPQRRPELFRSIAE